MANDFSGDSNCKALWRFESGALTTDDIGSNSLTNYDSRVSADTDSGDFHEGNASAHFVNSVSPRMYIEDADLDAGFPLKSSGSDTDLSVCLWLKLADTSANYILIAKNVYLGTGDESFLLYTRDYGSYYGIRVIKGYDSGSSNETWEAVSSLDLQAGQWYHIGLTWDDSSRQFHIVVWDDTAQTKYADSDTQTHSISLTASPLNLGCRANSSGVPDAELNGWLDEVVVFNDILTESEIDSIRQGGYGIDGTEHELFGSIAGVCECSGGVSVALAMFGLAHAATSVVGALESITILTGACTSQGYLIATLIAAGPVAAEGSTRGHSSIVASLRISSGLRSGPAWLQEALLNGMTANAFWLGTILTGGWFWMRRAGCCVIYRGPTVSQMDFQNIVSAADVNAPEVTLPGYLLHEVDSNYCYVVRRFNSCGYQEHTTAAAIQVRFDPEGHLAAPAPNGVYGLCGRSVAGDRIRLGWFYCPLGQEAAPLAFSVHTDGGTGQLDLQWPVTVIPYNGRRFYRYLSESLPEGRYVFVVRAVGANGTQSASLSHLHLPVKTSCPAGVTVLSAEGTA